MTAETWLSGLTAAALIVAGIWLYNRLVADRNLVRQGYADIDVQLKLRSDLVPRFVEAVRGYAAYEKALLTTVTGLRTSALAAGPAVERFDIERSLGAHLERERHGMEFRIRPHIGGGGGGSGW